MPSNFPPGPTSTRGIDPVNIQRSLVDHKMKYGAVSYFRMAGRHVVSFNTIAAIREALNHEQMKNRVPSFAGDYVLKEDVTLQPYSENWVRLRGALVAGLNEAIQPSEEMITALNSECRAFKCKLREMKGLSFDPRDLILSSVINETLIGLIGRRFEYDHDIFRCFKSLEDNGTPIFADPKANFILGKFPFLRYLPVGYGRMIRLAKQSVADISKYLLQDIKKEGDLTKRGMVYAMLRAQIGDDKIKDHHISATIADMYISGSRPTSAALLSFLHQLICHPDVQNKMQEEIDSVFSKDTQPTLEHLEKLPYAHATMLEVFRQCPVFWSPTRRNAVEVTMLGYTFPANSVMVMNCFGTNHDEKLWKDPWKFEPRRFLDNHGGYTLLFTPERGKLLPEDHPTRKNLIAYGEGIRRCPGEDWVPARVLLFMIRLLQSFEVSSNVTNPLPDGDPMKYTRSVTLYPPPFMVTLKER